MGQQGLVGRTLGRYRLDGVLGSGGFATVYRATDTALDRPVALKVLDPGAHRDPMASRRFVNEGRVLATLDHPAIVPIYDVGDDDDGLLWLAVRLVNGPSLDRVLYGRTLRREEVLGAVDRLAAALDHAHRQDVVHRDVKPANVLLEDGRPERAWLTDFGIASTARTAGRHTVDAIGTAAYMAPEQGRSAEGTSRAGPPADLYALACIVFEMLTGRRPYAGDDAVALLVAHATAPIPTTGQPPLDRFFETALAKDTAARPPSAEALAAGLRAALAEAGPLEIAAAPPGQPPPAVDSPTMPQPDEVSTRVEPVRDPVWSTAVQPAPPAPGSGMPPQEPVGHLTSQAQRRARRTWPWSVALGLVLVGVLAGVLAWSSLSGPGPVQMRRVTDPGVGVTFGVPVGWGSVEDGPGSITVIASDGTPVAEITHEATAADDDPLAELEASSLCERQPERATVGGAEGARCTNSPDVDPAAALSAVANDRTWLIQVSSTVPTREAEAFLSTVEFT